MAIPTLVGESFSPWTQKARWALEYCGIAHHYQEYTPTISEPGLRLRMRAWSGPISVPVLLDGGKVVRGSWNIAAYARESVQGQRLGDLREAKPWDDLSEAALAEGRTRVVRSVLQSPAALDEALSALFPPALCKPLRFIAKDAARRLDRKYAHLVVPGSIRTALERTRERIQHSGCDYLLGAFSYADMVMVVVLETVAPMAVTVPPLGPATRACWTDLSLAAEFSDLLAWRARIIASVHPAFSQLPPPPAVHR